MSGINCTAPGCLASTSWFGHPADPALADLAKKQGWVLFEGAGWTCPHHIKLQESSHVR